MAYTKKPKRKLTAKQKSNIAKHKLGKKKIVDRQKQNLSRAASSRRGRK